MEKYGFVYIWRDRKHNRYYIGAHFGYLEDGYICSSTWMKQGYRHRPEDFKRRILKTNILSKKEMFEEENKWLNKIKPEELGKKYYNLQKHWQHWSMDEEKYKSSVEKMKNSLKKTNAAMTQEERSLKYGNRRGTTSPRKGMSFEQEYGIDKAEEIRNKIKEKRAKQVIDGSKLKGREPWNKGKTGIYSEETKKKMAWNKGMKIENHMTVEGRKSVSEKNKLNMKLLWQNPEYREKMLSARKKV